MQVADLDKALELEDTIADANASKKVIFEEAKAEGFSPKGIKYIIKQRKKDRDQIAEEQELFSVYSKAAGL